MDTGGRARSGAQRVMLALFLAGIMQTGAFADHALTQEGEGLFNVSVEQTATTWSRPLRVRWQNGSFEYDYAHNQIVHAYSEGSALYWLADVVTTETTVGKNEARALMKERQWNQYVPPPPRVIVLPTPTPQATAAPTPLISVSGSELADQALPLASRIEKQREIFLDQQRALIEQLKFTLKMHQVTNEQAVELKKKLIRHQIDLLKRYYPQDDEQVRLTIEALADQFEKVSQNGRFSWEF
jgi:hypothetical protein